MTENDERRGDRDLCRAQIDLFSLPSRLVLLTTRRCIVRVTAEDLFIPRRASAKSISIAPACLVVAAKTVMSPAYASTVILLPPSEGSNVTPQLFVPHFGISGLITWPNNAENNAGESGSPCLIPDFRAMVVDALPCRRTTASLSYILSRNAAASGASGRMTLFAKLSSASLCIL